MQQSVFLRSFDQTAVNCFIFMVAEFSSYEINKGKFVIVFQYKSKYILVNNYHSAILCMQVNGKIVNAFARCVVNFCLILDNIDTIVYVL